jgi:predicted PurR-regulated permease PerM
MPNPERQPLMTETPSLPSHKPAAPMNAPDASKAITVFVMIVVILYFGREVLVPITLALLLAFVLAPIVGLLRRLRLGRVPSVLLGVFLALGIILGIGGIIGSHIADLSGHLPQYAARVESKIAGLKAYAVGHLADLAVLMRERKPPSVAPAVAPPVTVAPSATTTAPAPNSSPPPADASPLSIVEQYIGPVLSPFPTIGIVFVVAVFALLQQEDLRDRLIRLIGSDDLHRTTLAIDDGGRRLSRYFLTQLCINILFGLVVGIGLWLIGVPDPTLWGILSALLRFVPYAGALLSAALPMALAAAVEPGWAMVARTAVLYLLAESITGQVIEPMVYGRSTGLSPFAVIVAAIFWSWLWGPIGLILSTPLTLCLVVIGRHVKRLEFLDVMLGDRPALTPVESFYQRLLAGDADETQDHAELLLKDRSLSTYYEEVVIKGLQLAANDAHRGTLDYDRMERVKRTIKLLIHGLQSYEDAPPAPSKEDQGIAAPRGYGTEPTISLIPDGGNVEAGEIPETWRDPSAILCIAGRGPLDDAPASILAQLLGKHGMGARLVEYQDVSREQIDTLEVGGVTMVCILYLDMSGNPAHLRYLMLRLRRRLPVGTPILVGVWPASDATLETQRIKTTVGADYFAISLDEAVALCASAARATLHHSGSTAIASTSERYGSLGIQYRAEF